MKRMRLPALLFSLATLSVAAMARTHTGTLSGTVIGPDGSMVAGARVTVQQADGRHPHATLTGADGRFEFRRLSVGPYDVRAYSRGVWSEWQHYVIVRSRKLTKIELRLPAAEKK